MLVSPWLREVSPPPVQDQGLVWRERAPGPRALARALGQAPGPRARARARGQEAQERPVRDAGEVAVRGAAVPARSDADAGLPREERAADRARRRRDARHDAAEEQTAAALRCHVEAAAGRGQRRSSPSRTRSTQASPTGVDTFHGKCGVEVLT